MKKHALILAALSFAGVTYAAGGCCPVSAAKPSEADAEVKSAVTLAVKAEAPAKVEVVTEKADKPVKAEVEAGETLKVAVAEVASCPVAGKCTAAATCGDKEDGKCGDKGEAACSVREASAAAATCGDACTCKG
jgi:hypothetical protein